MPDSPHLRSALQAVSAFVGERDLACYVVGGAVRDALLGRARAHLNIDLAVPSGALEISRQLARQLGAAYVPLDEAAGSARIVVAVGEDRFELDVSDFRGATIDADLAKRDFTINAMAVPLDAWVAGDWQRRLIDPLGGQADLERRRLRACFPGTFEEDVVRILRAFRFAVELGCELDAQVRPLIQQAAPRLRAIAGERIREELFAIFETDRAHWALQQLEELGVVDILFPELSPGRGIDQGGYHHLDVFNHELETVAQADRMLRDFAEFSAELREPMARYCAETPVEHHSRAALIKLAGLYHDVGKPGTRRVEADGDIWFIGHEHFGASLVEAVTERLHLSNRESDMVAKMVLYHLRPGHLSREPQLTPRAIYRFFRDLGDDGPACLLVWWADRMATRGPMSRLDQIDQQRARLEELLHAYFFQAEAVVRPPRLIDGRELMDALGLSPGPRVGELLRIIQEAQAEGRVTSKDSALAVARQHPASPPSASSA